MKGCLLRICFLFFAYSSLWAQNDDMFGRVIELSDSKGSTYEILTRISDLSGFLFIYDSDVVNNNQVITIPSGNYTLRDAIVRVVGVGIDMKMVGNHILLHRAEDRPNAESQVPALRKLPVYRTLEGMVRDRETGEPIPYCSVNIPETGIGTVTNQNGQFLLKLSDSLQNVYIRFSHIGYELQQISSDRLSDNQNPLYLDPRTVSLDAVVIQSTDPKKLIEAMLDSRSRNYASEPFYLTTFYREGTNRKRKFDNLSEAVFRVYKSGYDKSQPDRVKLIKMRTIRNDQERDTFVMKMKAGVDACLLLDIVKNLPDFLVLNERDVYRYTKTGMAVTDEHWAHVIAFEQKPGIKTPMYQGEFYIDEKNNALLHARFQIHPDYVEQAQYMFVVKKNKDMEIIPREAVYSLSYRKWNGKYYIDHIRGDLTFKIKKKKMFFFNTATVHTYFEMVTCGIDTLQVKRFPIKESQPTRNVFSETNYVYDEDFWSDFNIIPPEEKLTDAISRISAKIEENIAKEEIGEDSRNKK